MKVAPSIIAAKFTDYQEEIVRVEKAGADLLHLDVMDGVFVPNITFGPMIVEAINEISTIDLDAHLMIAKPENYLKQFIDAGLDWISFHCEATKKTDECIRYIQERGVKAGLAINPPTSFDRIKEYVEKLDYLLIMTVNPGFYGQQFIADVLSKIEEAKDWMTKHKLRCLIEVDGGINATNAALVCQAGADIVVAGAGIFKSSDYRKAVEELRCSKA
ncbi:ribulose phosphate epimerase [candidate division WOR_3 bacterium SM23_42]|uniref:Ribulose-phosphate 3-epimerase n=1 Tax=candidate division WOR_3 bacterium SM23_42 TaxID=1703779 RepID=A0A0S8FXE6_UNCW3|nr:MAG: ribulose phosphate epimerase [candidate division WOR_3 bacterium SM23_42]